MPSVRRAYPFGAFLLLLCASSLSPALAQDSDSSAPVARSAATNAPSATSPTISAPRSVREGNRHLRAGDAPRALESYNNAKQLLPDSREVAFVEGLAHYDLKEYDKAREAFERAGPFAGDALADDALYSLGTCDHREALDRMERDPRSAVGLLESAMQRYRDVLSNRSDHRAARDANFKAASMWRRLKAMMQQQQQQRQESDPNEDREEHQQQDQNNQEQQDQQQSSQEQESENKEQQSDASQSPDQQEQQQGDEQKKKQAAAQEQEKVSKEQAERRLREMMQAVRDRKKRKPQRTRKIPVRPVDKDW